VPVTAPSHIPAELINDFDIYDDRLADNFRHCLDHLPPVSYTTANGGHWIIQGYKEITAAMRDPETFSSWPASLPADLAKGRGRFIPLEYDPPEHGAYRSVLSSYFSVGRVRQLEDTFRSLARSLIDQFADAGECDFMESFARPFPAMMFLGLMGWPPEKMADFCAWVDGFQHGGGGLSDDERVKDLRAQSIASTYEYFRGFVRARRAQPRDDITSVLVQAVLPDGRQLTEDEILDYIFLLLIAGLHTVEGALAFGVMHFATHPEDRQRVIDEPRVLLLTVEELLRLEPPAWGTGRVAAREVTIGGVTIRPGEKVLLPHQTANLDPSAFPDPDRFDPRRAPNPHVSFGGGPHRCMGAHLARMELRVAFEELHTRIRDYTLDRSRPPVQHMSQTRGVASLHIRFGAPAADAAAETPRPAG
jgi:cytochrome P450